MELRYCCAIGWSGAVVVARACVCVWWGARQEVFNETVQSKHSSKPYTASILDTCANREAQTLPNKPKFLSLSRHTGRSRMAARDFLMRIIIFDEMNHK